MKKIGFPLLLLVVAMILSACGAAASEVDEASVSIAGEYLNTEYTDAASLRNQLAYGTLLIADTPHAVTAEQAATLAQLWQALVVLSSDETTADEEITAIQNQIAETLNDAQLQAIADLKITTASLNDFYAEHGIVFPTPIPGVTKEPGSGSGKSEEDKIATQTAAQAAGMEPGGGNSSSAGQAAKTLLFDKVIEYLINLAE